MSNMQKQTINMTFRLLPVGISTCQSGLFIKVKFSNLQKKYKHFAQKEYLKLQKIPKFIIIQTLLFRSQNTLNFSAESFTIVSYQSSSMNCIFKYGKVILIRKSSESHFRSKNKIELFACLQINFSQKLFQIMNNSMIISNVALHCAYEHFQAGKIELGLQEYKKALKDTFADDLKTNIKCTIAILQQELGYEDKASELVSLTSSSNKKNQSTIIMLRLYANLTLMNIFEQKYTKALDYFQNIMQIIQKEDSLLLKKQLLQLITFLFFRVKDLQEISEFIQNCDMKGMKIWQIYAISLMAFNSQICKVQNQQKIQKMCYQSFMKHQRYDLALFSLRSLIFFTKNLVNKQQYDRQLAKLVMRGYFSQNIDFNNYEPYQIIQAIMQQFMAFRSKILQEIFKQEMKDTQMNQSRFGEITDNQLIIEWKYTIPSLVKELNRSKDMQNDSKKAIFNILENMKQEMNALIIRSMLKNNYFMKYYEKTQSIIKNMAKMFKGKTKNFYQSGFDSIKNKRMKISISFDKTLAYSNEVKEKCTTLKKDRSKSLIRVKQYSIEEKENYQPMGISIVSITSSKISKEKEHSRKKIFQEQSIQIYHKKMLKMVKVCEYGCFLNKRNFNSQGGQFKFVKITNAFIKWGKDPEKIETNCQVYPLKDIKSIVYGRISPNLNQPCNKMLNYSKCFSLLFQKRTLDFYCKNYQQLQAWVCGLSHVLKKQQIRVVGYTPGKLRWKKMFAILKQNFIEPLKTAERNKYYYENAYAVKLFAKNGYKLPSKTVEKR